MTRKTCESTNWFEYGQNVALEGRRLTGDNFLNECYKAEADIAESDLDRGFKAGMAKYCLPEQAYLTGRNGNFFNEEMCTGQGVSQLRLRHNAGVLDYCKRENGYGAGASGKVYQKICPSELEKAFLPEYNRGRVRYLNTLRSQNSTQINQYNQELNRMQSELGYKKGVLIGLQATSNSANISEDQKNRLRQLNYDVSTLETSVNSTLRKREALEQKNREIELEIIRLGN
jgi:hypothetical protein